MAKVALLVGVSEYEPGLNPLPGAVKDVDAMQRVLAHPEMGGFAETDITVLKNPQRQAMEDAIYSLFSDRKKDDLLLFYFSGHGIKDESGRLYLATRATRKDSNGRLVPPSAVAAASLHENINASKSQRQVMILDCCFSGAIAQGMTVKDDGTVNLKDYLGGKGRAILTSSTSTEYSFGSATVGHEDEGLSIYTRYLVEGIEKGSADTDGDGWIAVEELHEYAANRVKEAAPAMTPKFYPVEEGYKIVLARSRKDDPKLKYRKEVESVIHDNDGKITFLDRGLLDEIRSQLNLSEGETNDIETQVLRPYQERQEKLERYEQYFTQTIQTEYPLTENSREKLNRLLQFLHLRLEDVIQIETCLLSRKELTVQHEAEKIKIKNAKQLSQYSFFKNKKEKLNSLIHEMYEILQSLHFPEANTLVNLEISLQSDSFKIMVLGEFKRGKSTFINALLGNDLLPSSAVPCTAIITEVKWGESPKAVLHFTNTEVDQENCSQEIPINQLEEYVAIQYDEFRGFGNNRYAKVELFYPIELCQNGVEIIDIPGLNEAYTRQKITTDYLPKVDAIVFVFTCEIFASQSELHLIDNMLKPLGHEDIFFICNKFDQVHVTQRERLKQFAISKLAPKTHRGAERIFFISAFNALEGRLNNDSEMVTKSGIVQVERELEKFLANERGQIKILRPAQEVKNIIYSVRRSLLGKKPTLSNGLGELRERIDAIDVELNELIAELSLPT